MIEVIEDCQLEWDKTRGVIYVHNRATGATVLRIGGLEPSNRILTDGMIDVLHPKKVTYPQ